MSDTPSTPFGISEIGQIGLPVRDLDRAVSFYRDTLGMPFLFQVPNLAFFNCSGVRLMLSIPETAEFEHPGSIIYYRVANLEQTYQAIEDRGAIFDDKPHLIADMPDHELWMAFLKDSEGNTVGLMSEKPKTKL